jgi:RNA polymerase sigma-70 factor (ECF subfamily)
MNDDREQSGVDPSVERELVLAAQRGDRSAQKSLYQLYHERVYSLVFYALDDTTSAEDVTQIVFLKIYSSLNRFRYEAAFSTWVYRIALNECLNRNQRRGLSHLPLDEVLGSMDERDKNPSPDIRHEQNQRQEIIQRAVMELSPKLRSVVILKYVEGLSYEEIAEVLKCSTGTVASRLSRALAQLESRLRPLQKIL